MIKKARPPNFADIVTVFPMARSPTIIFSYAPDIYVPSGNQLPDYLMEHEKVHVDRQKKMGVEDWWQRYLANVSFRFEEELVAHRREYQVMKSKTRTWKAEQVALKTVAKKLASPLYGRMVSTAEAMAMLDK